MPYEYSVLCTNLKKSMGRKTAFKVIYVEISQTLYAKILFMSAVTFHDTLLFYHIEP